MEKTIETHLGQKSQYSKTYDPTLLVREPRQTNREYLDIDEGCLPFVGYDTWNCYEVSMLDTNGMPVVGVLKIVYPCNSKYIVESKSLKLYLNSFNMTKVSARKMCKKAFTEAVQADLAELLETNVECTFFDQNAGLGNNVHPSKWYERYHTLEDLTTLDFADIEQTYTENPDFLRVCRTPAGLEGMPLTICSHSALLKSNCKVTGQPDFGDVYIEMTGTWLPDAKSLLQYIVSFRDECHFHEEICECIYKRLWDIYQPDELHVMCLYTRRGGIDICPQRASDKKLLNRDLMSSDVFHIKTIRQ